MRLLILLCCLCIGACSSVPVLPEKTPSYKVSPPHDTNLGEFIASSLQQHAGETGVLPLMSGVDAYIARLAIVKGATKSIDMQYYIYRNDDTGKLLLWQLIDAADRGVRVRILLDDLTTKNQDENLLLLARHPNIDVRLFNPAFERRFRGWAMIADFGRLNNRMHNKSLTVDNQISIVGGRNIGNEYFSNNDDVDFGDFDLLSVGKAVDEISEQFDQYWNAPIAVEIAELSDPKFDQLAITSATEAVELQKEAFKNNPYLEKLKMSELLAAIQNQSLGWYWGDAQVIYDPPEKVLGEQQEHWLLSDLSSFLSQAKQQVVIVSPYFVPTSSGTDELVRAARSGIDITVITNSLAATDVLAVHSGYQRYRERLLRGGVKIFEVKADAEDKPSGWKGSSKTSLHAKTFIIDSQSIFVGSFNFDPRSAYINTEMGVIFDAQDLASELQQGVMASLNKTAYEVKLVDDELVWLDKATGQYKYAEPSAGFWRKFMADLLSLLPIESQL
ncbi:phospholipase D family protein [Shewanella sp. Scap07]|uniref:phospholipase D family protein n=1 Tax=Shewanella sp. Scap07 TaxID=2589987 RepID=UPI0021172CD2|nr:phospholipase D family protein [Shewanella sp. Scap07]